jgi:hypothetical protein
LFQGLSPSDFPCLSHLEIRDNEESGHAWRDVPIQAGITFGGRLFSGLLSHFLVSLDGLTSLWVDEKVLLPGKIAPIEFEGWGFWTLREMWEPDSESAEFVHIDKGRWRADLQAVLSHLESLRVGFGAMNDAEVGLALSCCDETRLRQFGFERSWKVYGPDDVRDLSDLSGPC